MSISPYRIRIAAAVISNQEGRVLLVRKQGTRFFMQPGGKIGEGETEVQALARELREELGCTLTNAEFLGVLSASAANEPEHIVEAMLYRAEIAGGIVAAAEIAELAWVDPAMPGNLVLAPLTRDEVLPLIAGARGLPARLLEVATCLCCAAPCRLLPTSPFV